VLDAQSKPRDGAELIYKLLMDQTAIIQVVASGG